MAILGHRRRQHLAFGDGIIEPGKAELESTMKDYHHTQRGLLIQVLIGVVSIAILVSALVSFIYGSISGAVICLAVAVLMILVLCLFHSLTVHVSKDQIKVKFGVGLICTSFAVSEIRSVKAVRNHWISGWGIRWIPGGWLYNVSGFDAVELNMASGRRYRIGTDEPQALLAAIETAMSEA
jgi:hypothetical protein